MKHAIRSLCFCCALLGLLLGCGGGRDNPIEPIVPPGPPRYYTPSAPESTVLNYALAWERRDSTMIATVLTDDYQGVSFDQTDPVPSPLSFSKSDEIRAVSGLRLDTEITSVHVGLASGGLVKEYNPGDPPDWVTVRVSHPSIVIARASANDLKCTGSQLEFKLTPTASGADTTWKIVRWSEVHQSP